MEHSHLITPSRRAVQRSQQAEGTRPAEQRTRSAEVSTEHGEHRTTTEHRTVMENKVSRGEHRTR